MRLDCRGCGWSSSAPGAARGVVRTLCGSNPTHIQARGVGSKEKQRAIADAAAYARGGNGAGQSPCLLESAQRVGPATARAVHFSTAQVMAPRAPS